MPQPALPKRMKRVTFDSNVLVYEVPYYSLYRDDMFYSDEEYDGFYSDIKEFLLVDNAAVFSADDLIGLETFISDDFKIHKWHQRLRGTLAVLMEQDRQYKELGFVTPMDDESMSYHYHNVTDESQKEAHKRALAYLHNPKTS
jgi:hypothetical protein